MPGAPLCALVAVVLATLFVSCASDTRYRVLDFLFDGVPDPNAPVEQVEQERRVDFTNLTAAERAEYLANRIEAPVVYFHEPVQKQECDSCHVAETRSNQTTGWMSGLPQLVVPIDELCVRCHESPEAPYVHGPVATGRCDICHVAHQSPFPHLLRYERVNETCRTCHQGEIFVTEQDHEQYGDQSCADCHEPHQSDLRHLLRSLEARAERTSAWEAKLEAKRAAEQAAEQAGQVVEPGSEPGSEPASEDA